LGQPLLRHTYAPAKSCEGLTRLYCGLHLAFTQRPSGAASGVSSERQRNYLVAKGCHELQGYLLARPLPIEGLLAVLGRGG
jgi:predicted signal transduction protein with EAL and GGDEF domain